MDSSRSGLLSTLLMTLPLIVVPAIALLRPPGQLPGISTSALDASDSSDSSDSDDDFLDDFGDLETGSDNHPKSSDRSLAPETDIFAEEPKKDRRSDNAAKPQEKKRKPDSGKSNLREPNDPFMAPGAFSESDESDSDSDDTGAAAPETATGPSAEQIVEQLNAQGALRTMWFEAGSSSPVGFAVFFRGSTELMRYRFEAVGQTREECARDVLDQVKRWQMEQAGR